MNIAELLKTLSVDSLTEEQQTEFTTKLEDIISFRVNEAVDEALTEEKEKLVEEYEAKYEDYKQDITSKFSNFVDEVLEEEMIVPEYVLEYARYGELYKDLIDQIKVRVGIDEGILDEEARDLLREARDRIIELQDALNDEIELRLESQNDAQDLALETYRRMACEDVPVAQRKRVLVLLEGTKTKEEVDRKLDFIMENKLFEGVSDDNNDGKGQHTVNEDKSTNDNEDKLDEDSPFDKDLSMWAKILKG